MLTLANVTRGWSFQFHMDSYPSLSLSFSTKQDSVEYVIKAARHPYQFLWRPGFRISAAALATQTAPATRHLHCFSTTATSLLSCDKQRPLSGSHARDFCVKFSQNLRLDSRKHSIECVLCVMWLV